MTEYRIGELAGVSGVTERNIRAYRERGLLAPPRRSGRDAFYGDHHVAQLETINQLLAKGFSSAHIAAFLDGIRRGEALTDVLGIGPQTAAALRAGVHFGSGSGHLATRLGAS